MPFQPFTQRDPHLLAYKTQSIQGLKPIWLSRLADAKHARGYVREGKTLELNCSRLASEKLGSYKLQSKLAASTSSSGR